MYMSILLVTFVAEIRNNSDNNNLNIVDMKTIIEQKRSEAASDSMKAISMTVLVMAVVMILGIAETPYNQSVSPWMIVATFVLGLISFGCMGIIFGDEDKEDNK